MNYKIKKNNPPRLLVDEELDIITELINCFFDAIAEDDVLPDLPDTGKHFCDKYNQKFLVFEEFFGNSLPGSIEVHVQEQYNIHINELSRINPSKFLSYSSRLSTEFVERLEEYCCKNRYDEIPIMFSWIIRMISAMFVNDQNMFKLYKKQEIYTDKDINHIKSTVNVFVKEFNEEIDKHSESINMLTENTKEQIKTSEKKSLESNITILGIFSAVVLTFNAILSFSDVAMENFVSSTIYRSTLITSILGFVIGNIMLGLISYLKQLRGAAEVTPIDGKTKCEKFWNYVKTPHVMFNIIMITIIIANIICWRCGVVEDRNIEIEGKYTTTTTSEHTTITNDETNQPMTDATELN